MEINTELKQISLEAILEDLPLENGLENIDCSLLTSYIIEAGYSRDFYKSKAQVASIRIAIKKLMMKRHSPHISNKIYLLTHNLLNYHRQEIGRVLESFEGNNN